MCDSVVVVPDAGPVWFAKNSDREPTEAQFLECHDGEERGEAPEGLPWAPGRRRLLLSRPAWMWGCEMGVNEYGVAIGNEAVFTRPRVPKAGYTGMDFQRVALTSCESADDALEQLIELTETFVQGGPMAHQHRSFRYHSSFLVADAQGAWVFETAGQYWAAKRVRGVATISNALTIGDDFDRVHAGAYAYARRRGWAKSANGFGFAGAFSDPFLSLMSGAQVRRACTERSLRGIVEPATRDFIHALTDHGATEPGKGFRSESPCAHAAWLPTKTSAQTTSSIIARLDANGPTVWATGTSSPCLSVFKPAPFDPELLRPRSVVDARFDARELWWAHERLHRACLESYHERRVTFADEHERLQDECLQPGADPTRAWRDHRVLVEDWLGRALQVKAPRRPLLTRRFWSNQARRTSMPA
ncbi:MAG: carcinine hydrolase/isopenicillin-N N-acyltransferase family protein [Polyangiales bacterium]